MSVTYTAVLPAGEHTADFLTGLLTAERARRGTRAGTRAIPARDQAILVLRWLSDGTRMRQLATDHQISVSTGYAYLHEGINVLAAHSPDGMKERGLAPGDSRRDARGAHFFSR